MTTADTERLARNAIRDDGAVTASDVPAVMKAKYQLLNRGGVLSFEYETTQLAELAGFRNLKHWLKQSAWAFRPDRPSGLEPPKGILLLGVQGCGKSLAAKATAGAFGLPLLRLDFGSLYNKYHGETERNLRESLQTAEVLSPCVLWLDEIEKGLATGNDDSGTARRVLGSLLTWMAERRTQVFLVATANEVSELPPELIRKGRFDEIFFVDLPPPPSRAEILDDSSAQAGAGAGAHESRRARGPDRRLLRRRDRARYRILAVRGPCARPATRPKSPGRRATQDPAVVRHHGGTRRRAARVGARPHGPGRVRLAAGRGSSETA